MTPNPIERWLVELACPIGPYHKRHFKACTGTGRRFPGLSRECPCLTKGPTPCTGCFNDYGTVATRHQHCNVCTDGRVAAVTVFGLLDALGLLHVDFAVRDERLYTYGSLGGIWPWTTEAELIEALERALAVAVQAESAETS